MFALLNTIQDETSQTGEDDRELLRPVSITSNDSDIIILTPYLRSHSHPEECIQHRRSEMIEFTGTPSRKIQKGCCLGHSQKGCLTFSGIDLETGQLLYISEWMIKYTQLEAKCAANCKRENIITSCSKHGVDEVITYIENQIMMLAQLKHNNLVRYECVKCVKMMDGIFVSLAQDFVLGNSVGNLSNRLDWCEQSASMIAKSVVDGLIFLHSNSVTHGLLCDAAVYIDNCSTIRITDFALVPYLQDLIGVQTIMKNDLEALGTLVESLMATPTSVMRDFIEKCSTQSTLTPLDLLSDPFLESEWQNEDVPDDEGEINKLAVVPAKCTEMSKSRFQSDYTNLEYLGVGGFGDVYKAKNHLDNREYAIKRIKLPGKSRTLYDGMTREVKLLSGLNHENVVRYYTSWIETAPLRDGDDKSILVSDGWSSSTRDCIEFINSADDDDCFDEFDADASGSEDAMLRYMYIQMEYCDGRTLRSIIDNQLFKDVDRLWRLFREIVEGLGHIHQQGMIHRDLKPANIFIGSRDQIKIGDFGLATTCRLAPENKEQSKVKPAIEVSKSLTGNVGTALYSAPELIGNNYDQKVDMYSLGIILFEMGCAPFDTAMERVVVLNNLRDALIKMPELLLNDPEYKRNVKIIRWLLNHNPSDRPNTEELLVSDQVPRAKVETNYFDEMLRNTVAHPESKQYKIAVAQFLEQESNSLLALTYSHVPVHQNKVEYVKTRIVNLFRKHGAIEVVTPLLTACMKNLVIDSNAVRLMTHSGNNVFLPHDLRLPFARHIAMNGINSMRRYSIERVYREDKVFNFHPKQLHECAFDIVTPTPGNLLVDAELIVTAYDITKELPVLQPKNISIRINHTTLLRSILQLFRVQSCKYDEVANNLLDFTEGKITKLQIKQILTDAVQTPKKSAFLLNVLTTEYSLVGENKTIEGSNLLKLINKRGAAGSLARAALRDIQTVVRLAQELGVNGSINLLPGLPVGYERTKSGGIVWQMLAEEKFGRHYRRYVLAAGERYDTFLSEIQKVALSEGIHLHEKKISGAGFSFSLENLMHAYATASIACGRNIDWAPLQVCIFVQVTRPPLKDIIEILKSLWAAGICSGFVEALTWADALEMAVKLGARHLVLLNENGDLTLRTFASPNLLNENQITRAELINKIQRMMEPDEQNFRVVNNDLRRKIHVLQQEKRELHKKIHKGSGSRSFQRTRDRRLEKYEPI